ncbi:CBL-interacting protein kinase [Echinococcus granulosus]|uniref:CBL-interacting protein kinase n=1 Tax=Echinococcus granulosus TaxID=6210 RepID=W6UTF8_ECHGR|nr:CBL-interacting protein kinase [Echinococcus granulosus]EUB56694.1 CBL-interacting protein kinase [Echinococcus granulosus]
MVVQPRGVYPREGLIRRQFCVFKPLLQLVMGVNGHLMLMHHHPGRHPKVAIATRQNLPEHECLPYFHGMLDAVTYIHSIGVIHRDIKPENMMIDNNNEIQLIDFGSSLVLELQGDDQVSGTIGTPAFLAPECVQGTGEAYSGKKADIWALGITLALMLTGKLLYDGLTKYDVFEAIRMRPFDIENRCISRHAVDLLTNALNRNPEERFDAMKLKVQSFNTVMPILGVNVDKNISIKKLHVSANSTFTGDE